MAVSKITGTKVIRGREVNMIRYELEWEPLTFKQRCECGLLVGEVIMCLSPIQWTVPLTVDLEHSRQRR